MKRYAKLGKQNIHPLIWYEGPSAFDKAQEHYARYSRVPFADDLIYYLREGWVVSRPNLFILGKPIVHDGRRGWFVQFAIGNLLELLTCFPCKLDFIAFCRKDDNNMRLVDFDQFIKMAWIMNKRKVA